MAAEERSVENTPQRLEADFFMEGSMEHFTGDGEKAAACSHLMIHNPLSGEPLGVKYKHLGEPKHEKAHTAVPPTFEEPFMVPQRTFQTRVL